LPRSRICGAFVARFPPLYTFKKTFALVHFAISIEKNASFGVGLSTAMTHIIEVSDLLFRKELEFQNSYVI